MKLLQISNGVSIMPDNVSSLVTAENGTGVTVHLKTGESYWVDRDYNQTGYKTHERLVYEINEAMK